MAEMMKFNKEQIAVLATSSKNAGEQLRDMWNSLKEKSLSTLDASWAGKDAAAYTTKVLEKENSVLAVCSALELLSKKYIEALELIKQNEESAYQAIENGGGQPGGSPTPDGGYVTEPAPTDAEVPPTQPLPTVTAPAPENTATPPQQPVETPPAQTAPPVEAETPTQPLPTVSEPVPEITETAPQQPVETPPAQTAPPVDPEITAQPLPTVSAPVPETTVTTPQQPVETPPAQVEVPVDPGVVAQPLPTVTAPVPTDENVYSPTKSYIEAKTGLTGGGSPINNQMTMVN